MGDRKLLGVLGIVSALALASAGGAPADGWLPHPADATWTWQWSDSAYSQTPTNELVTVKSQSGPTFVLNWTTDGAGNPDGTPTSTGTALSVSSNSQRRASNPRR